MRAKSSFKYLFTSAIRLALLQRLFYFPAEMFFTRQLTRDVGTEINAVRRELVNLKKAGLIVSEPRSNKIYHQANNLSPLFLDLVVIAHKTSGLGGQIHKLSDRIGKLSKIYYNQSFLFNAAKDGKSSSGVDILIIGQLILQEVEDLIKTEETIRMHEINYMVMSESELLVRKQKRDPFIVDFFLNEPVLIFGQKQNHAKS